MSNNLEIAQTALANAQQDYDNEVRIYDGWEKRLYGSFRLPESMLEFLGIRRQKQAQARVVAQAYSRLAAAQADLETARMQHEFATAWVEKGRIE
jgi:hypothetical protein